MAFLLSHLLTEAAARFPDKVAVACEGHALTYAALDEESSRLARLLRREGVQPGDRVGLFLHKSVETALGIFAVLKAGAAYVPLDPQAPPRRLGFIVRNCGIRCVLTKPAKLAALQEAFGDGWPLDLLLLLDGGPADAEAAPRTTRVRSRRDAAAEAAAPPACPTVDTDLAYILYTSGSTGDPKGVMISHLNALTFVNWASDTFRIEPSDQLSNHAPFHFDLSIFDLFAGVKAGATVHVVPESMAFFPASLARFIATHEITAWYSVPSALVMLVQHGQLRPGQFPHLRLVLFAGEVFPVKYLRVLMEAWRHARFYNLYGPTETNVCTYYQVKEIPDGSEPIPIGRACENTDVFALTDGLERARPGEIGELFVRGSSVMKGYWGLPDKTRQVVMDWTDVSGHMERVYRTGDLVVLKGEDYHFLGRRDHMIKSRGYRIELGEIEVALYGHPGVRDAVVLAIPDQEIGHRLHAMVVCAGGEQPSAAELGRHCAERIPKYMVPEVIEFRDHLPKTTTGKVDRQRLVQDVTARATTEA